MARTKGAKNLSPEEREAVQKAKADEKAKKQADREAAKAKKAAEKPGRGPGMNHHNSGAILDDEHAQALYFRHIKEYEKAFKDYQESGANLKNVCKRIKSEGGSVTDIKLGIKLQTPRGEGDFRDDVAQMLKVARWNGVGIQEELFAQRQELPDRAYGEGKAAGMKGEPLKPPYAPGAPGYDDFMRGYHDGQTVLAENFGKPKSDTDKAADSFDDAMPPAAPESGSDDPEAPGDEQDTADSPASGNVVDLGAARAAAG